MRFLFSIGLTACLAVAASAQPFPASRVAELAQASGILSNAVTNMHAEGDTLWTGPFLQFTPDDGATWIDARPDSLSRNRVFSIDVEGETIWVGLGYVDPGSDQQTAGGFLVSTDGGATFAYRQPQLDAVGDDVERYGISLLPALPVIVPQQSPPFDIDYDPATGDVWTAAWASGIRRSSDGGRTWQRVVLPPDNLARIAPTDTLAFTLEPQRGQLGNLNHMGFAVLVDETGTVWAGTPLGINRSRPEDVVMVDGTAYRAWTRFEADGGPSSLPGSWITSIEEQPLDGARNPIWIAAWNTAGQGEAGSFGVAVTRDGGETFEQALLLNERVYDFAFSDGVVWAASERGLFRSFDDGRTWELLRDFRDADRPDRFVRTGATVFSVATLGDAIWAGTADGLVRSDDGGETWRVFRVEVPLRPDAPSERIPTADAYAYPNPFSPFADGLVRIRYRQPEAGRAEVRIFDFGLGLVRTLDADGAAGEREIAWDGTDEGGVRVANGVYFYVVDAGGERARGKILVVE